MNLTIDRGQTSSSNSCYKVSRFIWPSQTKVETVSFNSRSTASTGHQTEVWTLYHPSWPVRWTLKNVIPISVVVCSAF